MCDIGGSISARSRSLSVPCRIPSKGVNVSRTCRNPVSEAALSRLVPLWRCDAMRSPSTRSKAEQRQPVQTGGQT